MSFSINKVNLMGMQKQPTSVRLAQSASALGAGILGFGIGAKWGANVGAIAVIAILIGAVIHVWGMYAMQQKESPQANKVAKWL
jgi:hypothetical protein